MVPFSFAQQEMRFLPGRALFWVREQALLVADLHLEKASFFATHGQMLPPYDSRETLERLAVAIRETGARRVYCLGDNFHDGAGPARLDPHATGMLAALTRATDWLWISGNHDEKGQDSVSACTIGGETAMEAEVNGIRLRHEARPGEAAPEISGHFHPRLTIFARGRRIARPCAVRGFGRNGADRVILPAFGALTGGMDAAHPAILSALQPARAIDALAVAGGRLIEYPLWQADRDEKRSENRLLRE